MSWHHEAWAIHAEGSFNVMTCDALGDGPDTWEGVREHGGACSGCQGPGCDLYVSLDVASDGTIWLCRLRPCRPSTARPGGNDPGLDHVLGVGPDGAAWLGNEDGDLFVVLVVLG
jgi:hypothetical protein